MIAHNTGRIGLGIFYLISCFANLFHTIHNTQYLWTVCLENVHLSIYKEFLVQIVIPNEKLIVFLIVVFEFIVAVLILSKELFVKIGLLFGIIWVLIITPFLPWSDILGHLLLGIFQAFLLTGTYDKTLLDILRSTIRAEELI
ncbi:MAG: hypothetical protein ACFFB5_14420 [Promethearchaeota archaeon]